MNSEEAFDLSVRRPTKRVTIFCDGSSLSNGSDAARAAAVALLGYQGLWRAFELILAKPPISRLKLWRRRSASRL
jgi:hypothetical protein